jgi:uncharacterized protein
MQIDYPYHFDNRFRTAQAKEDKHIRDMIEEFLFTNPGERINRPDFGSGLLRMVFEPNSPEIASALQFTIQAGLQRWLGDLIQVQNLRVTSENSALCILIQYIIRSSGESHTETYMRSNPV